MGNRRKVEIPPEQFAAMEARIVTRLKAGMSFAALVGSTGLSRNRIKEIAGKHDIDVADLSKRRRRAAWA